MTLLDRLHRWWLNRQLRVVTVRAAACRDEVEYLQDLYDHEPYNQALHEDLLHERARLHDLEEYQDALRAELAALSP